MVRNFSDAEVTAGIAAWSENTLGHYFGAEVILEAKRQARQLPFSRQAQLEATTARKSVRQIIEEQCPSNVAIRDHERQDYFAKGLIRALMTLCNPSRILGFLDSGLQEADRIHTEKQLRG